MTLVVLILHYFSLAFTIIAAALATVNSDLVEAAQIAGAKGRRIVLGIVLPVTTPALIAAGSLCFAGAVSNFAAPALLGLPVRMQTLSTRLYGMIEVGQVARGYVIGILLVLISALFLWLGNRAVSGRRSYATITGKGGHERCVPLNERVVQALSLYRHHRGAATPRAPFFLSRRRRRMSRGAIYERVRTCGHRARISKRASPHRLRHTFATHLVKAGVNIVTIRDLLGHKQISSTQVYLHVTADDLRSAAEKHPVGRLLKTIDHLLPNVKLPIQYPPPQRDYGYVLTT